MMHDSENIPYDDDRGWVSAPRIEFETQTCPLVDEDDEVHALARAMDMVVTDEGELKLHLVAKCRCGWSEETKLPPKEEVMAAKGDSWGRVIRPVEEDEDD